MTISSETNRNIYTGNDSATVFPYTFKILDQDEILVQKKLLTTGEVTDLVITTDYSVSGVGESSGGNITLVDTSDSAYQYIFTRNMEYVQETDYQEYDRFPASSHEAALDRLTMMVQQLQEQIDRCLKTNAGSEFDAELESPADSAGLVIVVNGTGDGFEFGSVPSTSYTFPLAGTGLLVQTSVNTATVRTLTNSDSNITITNGTGVSGQPTFDLASALTFTGKTIADGTFNNPTLVGATFSAALVDNISLSGNTISADNANGSITLAANGTGSVILGATGNAGIKLAVDSPILDSAGNEYIKFTSVPSAVNEFTILNASTGNPPILRSSGAANVGFRLSDSNGNEILNGGSTASAVNEITITNAATGVSPTFRSSGESNIGININDSNNNEIIKATSQANAVNEFTIANAPTGSSPTIQATGGDTNIHINATPKGTGKLVLVNGAFDGNKGADIASATTTDIGAATGNYVDVTGTTTITGLGTVKAGVERIVRFTGILTLTHNATSLILPGAASITTAAGDVGHFVSLGSGNWRCVAYTKASGAPIVGGTSVVVKQVSTQDGAVATGTTTMPADDTIPQNTEGTQFLTQAITPANASNILRITVTANAACSTAAYIVAGLFQDSTAGALAAVQRVSTTNELINFSFTYTMVAGTTSATTFKLRLGGSVASTITWNGLASARLLGGVMSSSITITEFTP